MFQMKETEAEALVAQNVIPRKKHFGGSLPYAFTEQGVTMLSSIINSDQAIKINIAIMRTFVKLREMLSSNKELAHKLTLLENRIEKYDEEIKAIFGAIRRGRLCILVFDVSIATGNTITRSLALRMKTHRFLMHFYMGDNNAYN